MSFYVHMLECSYASLQTTSWNVLDNPRASEISFGLHEALHLADELSAYTALY